MNPFPEEYELISIFESEPKLLDDVVPWFYNTLFFKLQRDNDVLTCVMSPAYRSLSVELLIDDRRIYDLGFENIKGIHIEKEIEIERLIIEMEDESAFKTLIIQTRPKIKILTTHDNNFRK